ncbi:cytochrome P450 71D8-like [Arachis stenosperma]|uniref:cytochrome P450 71D8-like n=1 Tax=Arachis stenosperma TaxID=217475 RepID=UPI0025AC5B5E|nr:cytochrome P450 71D8-like [Arachis stenosperma]
MEAESSTLLVPTFFLLILFSFVVKYYKSKTKPTHKLPPGPWKLPLIGNFHQVAQAGPLPHRSLRELAKKYGPFMHLKLGENSTVVISSAKLAKEVLKTYDGSFQKRPLLAAVPTLVYGPADIVFSPSGDYWRDMRKICTLELLSKKKVQSLAFIREAEMERTIQKIRESAGSRINLSDMIFHLISVTVYRAAFGNSNMDHSEFILLIKEAMQILGGFHWGDLFPSIKPLFYLSGLKSKVENLHERLDRFMEDIIKEHQKKQTEGRTDVEEEDLVDVLLRVQQSGSLQTNLTITNVKAVIGDIFAAGMDTSAATLEWGMSEMMKNPRVMAKLQAELREALKGKKTIQESDIEELSYLKLVVKETLRLHCPTPLLIPRECTEETNIHGYDIPVKTRVMVNVWAIGRDPQYWHDAESFIPERFEDSSLDYKGNNFEYLPFGGGRRICPGMNFGVASITLPLALLLYHFNWQLPDGMKPEDLDMTEVPGLAIARKHPLCVIATPSQP